MAHWRRVLTAWLLLAMVMAQTTGFVHGTAHARLHQTGQVPTSVIAADAVGSVAATLSQLFDDHDDEAKCRLYDQVSRSECAPTPDMATQAEVPLAAAPLATITLRLCGICLPARARGPPSAA